MTIFLQSGTTMCELPNPLEEDNEGCEASIMVHTSITNVTRVYKRTGGFRRLVMTFNLSIPKADELKQFIYTNTSRWFALTDYRARKWRVLLTSNPVEFTEHARHRVSVTLDFLGVHL